MIASGVVDTYSCDQGPCKSESARFCVVYAATTTARTEAPSQGGQYLPPQLSYQPAQLSHQSDPLKHAPVQPLVRPALLGQPGSPHPAMPPVASVPPLRSQNGGWNDAPVVEAERRIPNAPSISKPAAIVSPFPHASQSPPPPGSPFNPGENYARLPPLPRSASVQRLPYHKHVFPRRLISS